MNSYLYLSEEGQLANRRTELITISRIKKTLSRTLQRVQIMVRIERFPAKEKRNVSS